MTISNKNTDSLTSIINELNFIYNKKKIIIPSVLIGLFIGFIVYKNQSNPSNIEYQNIGYLNSNVVHNEIISDLLKNINNMDENFKAKNLNLPIKTASYLKSIELHVQGVPPISSDAQTRSKLQFQINYTEKSAYNDIMKGVLFYIHSNKYILDKFEQYKITQEKKVKLLSIVNKEIEKIEKLNQNFKGIEDYNKKSNADLYTLKLRLEDDIIETSVIINIIDLGAPKNLSIKYSMTLLLFCYAFFGFVFGLIAIYGLNYLKQLKIRDRLKTM